jgi:hypothetical protein
MFGDAIDLEHYFGRHFSNLTDCIRLNLGSFAITSDRLVLRRDDNRKRQREKDRFKVLFSVNAYLPCLYKMLCCY